MLRSYFKQLAYAALIALFIVNPAQLHALNTNVRATVAELHQQNISVKDALRQDFACQKHNLNMLLLGNNLIKITTYNRLFTQVKQAISQMPYPKVIQSFEYDSYDKEKVSFLVNYIRQQFSTNNIRCSSEVQIINTWQTLAAVGGNLCTYNSGKIEYTIGVYLNIDDMIKLSREDQKAIIRHEIGHLVNYDLVSQALVNKLSNACYSPTKENSNWSHACELHADIFSATESIEAASECVKLWSRWVHRNPINKDTPSFSHPSLAKRLEIAQLVLAYFQEEALLKFPVTHRAAQKPSMSDRIGQWIKNKIPQTIPGFAAAAA